MHLKIFLNFNTIIMFRRCIILMICFLIASPMLVAQLFQKGSALPAWQEGYLDLHHINTGRGNCAYYVFPDGTTLLFDAGEQHPTEPRTLSARNSAIRPGNSKRPYEWIVSYIRQVAPKQRPLQLDYAILSHFHEDHMGAHYEGMPKSAEGYYGLSGITGVASLIPVKMLLDRGYPSYSYPLDMKGKQAVQQFAAGYLKTMQNYFAFIEAGRKSGMSVGRVKAGSRSQIALKMLPQKYPNFYVQNIKSNGQIWTGKDSATFEQFPALDTARHLKLPTENALCQVITINYGPFRYYTGGDIPGNLSYGDPAWMDVETPVAKAVGAVDVATVDHHGNRDAANENMVSTLRPRVWVEQVWSSDHPGHEVLIRLTTPYLYKGQRDLFATNMLQANKDVIGSLIDRSYKSQQGHIVVRVVPGGKQYYVIILDDSKEQLTVKDSFGPYDTQPK